MGVIVFFVVRVRVRVMENQFCLSCLHEKRLRWHLALFWALLAHWLDPSLSSQLPVECLKAC